MWKLQEWYSTESVNNGGERGSVLCVRTWVQCVQTTSALSNTTGKERTT